MPEDEEEIEPKSIAPAVVLIDREGESAMRRAARFARQVGPCWQALHESTRIAELQGQLQARLTTVENDLLCWTAEGRRIPEDPLPCGLERWQGRLRVLYENERTLGRGEDGRGVRMRRQLRQNAQDFRDEVQQIVRASRAAIVATQRAGSFEITEHGEAFD